MRGLQLQPPPPPLIDPLTSTAESGNSSFVSQSHGPDDAAAACPKPAYGRKRKLARVHETTDRPARAPVALLSRRSFPPEKRNERGEKIKRGTNRHFAHFRDIRIRTIKWSNFPP